MRREIWFWVIFFIVVGSAAVYFRYYYQPQMSVAVNFATSNSTIGIVYPFQKVALPINVSDIGSGAIKNLSISVLVNGNISTVYSVTMPPGKLATILYNFTPTTPGTYNITAIADLGKLYRISDRQRASSSVLFDAVQPEKGVAYSVLPEGAYRAEIANATADGFLTMEYLNSNYGLRLFNNTAIPFMSRLINITASYIKEISFAYDAYDNGSEAYSVWLQGYLNPSVISIAANASGVQTKSYIFNGTNVTYVDMGSGASLCSWYAGGWLKTLVYYGNESCIGIVNASYSSQANATMEQLMLATSGRYNASNEEFNFASGSFAAGAFGGATMLLNKSGIFIPIETLENANASNKCLGIISLVNGTYYCSSYLFPKNGTIGSISALVTEEIIGNKNLSVITFANTSRIMYSIAPSISVLRQLNITGKSMAFESPFASMCSIGTANAFACSNPTFAMGNLTFSLTNRLSSGVFIKSIQCYFQAPGAYMPFNLTIPAGSSRNASVACYDGSSKLSGLPLNLHLELNMNYTSSGKNYSVPGNATINSIG